MRARSDPVAWLQQGHLDHSFSSLRARRTFGQGEKGAVLARMLMSDWQVIFLQSKANGGAYDGERFPGQKWDWPRATWFQNRLCYLRKSQPPVVRTKPTTVLS